MQFTEWNIKNFGQLSQKRVSLQEGINLFYGGNESGKSTMHTFVKSMLFGMERGKGRAAANDTFSRYEPWEQPNFYAGSIRFTSGGKHFFLERNFDKYQKSARLLCEDDGEEFSLEDGDLEAILGGLDEEQYENTISIGQLQIETGSSLAGALQNFATNYYATGRSEIDLERAIQTLRLRKKEVEKELRRMREARENERQELTREGSYLQRDIEKLERELEETKVGDLEEAETENEKAKVLGRFPALCMGILTILFLAILPGIWKIAGVLPLAATILFLANGRKMEQKAVENQGKAEIRSWKQEHLQNQKKEKEVALGNLMEQIEELEDAPGEEALRLQIRAVELAESRILELSKDVYQELSGKLNVEASRILEEITGGKYTRLFIDEKLQMWVWSQDRKVDLRRLSRGTVEQIYFALRMAATDLLYEEEYPIILDDTFVYYDDDRLRNTLKWLQKQKKQVILFTCQKREGEILKELS